MLTCFGQPRLIVLPTVSGRGPLGVDFAQGFHIHEPEPLAAVLAELDIPDSEFAKCFADAAEPS